MLKYSTNLSPGIFTTKKPEHGKHETRHQKTGPYLEKHNHFYTHLNSSVLTSNPKAFKAYCMIYPQFPHVNRTATQALLISETAIFLMHSSSKASVSFLQALHLSQSTPLSRRVDITLSLSSFSII